MSFDFEKVFKDAVKAMKLSFVEDLPDIEDYWKTILDNEKESLKFITEQYLKGKWDKAKYNNELDREKEVVEITLLTLQIMTKAAAQKAVNAGFEVLRKAVEAML